jgi:hypothetical protein
MVSKGRQGRELHKGKLNDGDGVLLTGHCEDLECSVMGIVGTGQRVLWEGICFTVVTVAGGRLRDTC